MEQIRYSILVPVYNVENYIEKCLESLLNQDFDKEKYEIIIVDDGSNDGSSVICDAYADNHSNVRIIHQENKGLLLARGTAVKEAIGKYFIMVDSDDYVEPDYLKVVDKYLYKYEPELLVCGYFKQINCIDNPNFVTTNEIEILSGEDFLNRFVTTDDYNRIWGKVILGQILKEEFSQIYNSRINIGEDKIQTAFIAKHVRKAVFIKECLYHYVYRDNSIVHYKTAEDIKEIIRINQYVRKIVSEAMNMAEYNKDKREKAIKKYDATSADGVMEHIYKYNIRNDIDSVEKISQLDELLRDQRTFFEQCKNTVFELKIYNIVRWILLLNKKYKALLRLDKVLYKIQKY